MAASHARDAVVLLKGRRYSGAVLSSQHAWEMAGKTALAIEAGYSWPPGKGTWMREHDVMSSLDLSCSRLKLPQRIRRSLLRLESWLPPGAGHANPPLNTEYIFDAGTNWSVPFDYFQRSHGQTALRAVQQAILLVRHAYAAELKGLHIPALDPNL